MPDLLLEFFSEEIPARMQAKAADDLRKLVTDALVEAGLVYEGAKAFVTPRRLTLSVHGVPVKSAGPEGRAQRPQSRRAGAGHRRVRQGGGAQVDLRRQGAAGQEGRFLRRGDGEGRAAGHRRDRGHRAEGGEGLPVAEVDALGRGFGERGRADLGAAAAFHRRHVRPGDRRAGGGALCGRRR